jgi:hypothetical protein
MVALMIQYIEDLMRGEKKKMIQAPDDKSIPIRVDVDNMFQGYSGMKKIEAMNRNLRYASSVIALKKGTERQWVAAYKDP